MERNKLWRVVLSFIFILFIISISYFTQRSNSFWLITQYVGAFAVYMFIIIQQDEKSFLHWITIAVVARISLLMLTPNLSDDVYRFLWDGELLAHDFHPFSHPPSWYMQNQIPVESLQSLYPKLNSPNYYTVYPPFLQYTFLAAVSFSDSITGSIVLFRLFILLAEGCTLWLLCRLLKLSMVSYTGVLLYALNPLVILELSGNLHPEAFMITFLLFSFYLIEKNKINLSAILFSLSIATKLIPLIIGPALVLKLGLRKSILFIAVAGITAVFLALPIVNIDLIAGFKNSLGYYFQKFEFNASIYYVVRSIGYWWYGYNIIQSAGVGLSIISTLAIVLFSIKRWKRNTENSVSELSIIFLGCYTLYLFFATTVHPWYITPLLAVSIFTRFRFPIVWSLFIFMTYAGYTATGFQENLLIVSVEYIVVLCIMLLEIRQTKSLWPKIA